MEKNENLSYFDPNNHTGSHTINCGSDMNKKFWKFKKKKVKPYHNTYKKRVITDLMVDGNTAMLILTEDTTKDVQVKENCDMEPNV